MASISDAIEEHRAAEKMSDAIYTVLDFIDHGSEECKVLTAMSVTWQKRLSEARASLLLLRPATVGEAREKSAYLRASDDLRDFGTCPADVADLLAMSCEMTGAPEQLAA